MHRRHLAASPASARQTSPALTIFRHCYAFLGREVGVAVRAAS